jgi:hypothetical protein
MLFCKNSRQNKIFLANHLKSKKFCEHSELNISKNLKKSIFKFLHQNFLQKNQKQKNKKCKCVIHRKLQIFFLVFLYFQYFKYFRRLGDRLVLRFISSKKHFFRVKKHFFRVKKHFFRVKKHLLTRVFFVIKNT